jgi:hypothetical protein
VRNRDYKARWEVLSSYILALETLMLGKTFASGAEARFLGALAGTAEEVPENRCMLPRGLKPLIYSMELIAAPEALRHPKSELFPCLWSRALPTAR